MPGKNSESRHRLIFGEGIFVLRNLAADSFLRSSAPPQRADRDGGAPWTDYDRYSACRFRYFRWISGVGLLQIRARIRIADARMPSQGKNGEEVTQTVDPTALRGDQAPFTQLPLNIAGRSKVRVMSHKHHRNALLLHQV